MVERTSDLSLSRRRFLGNAAAGGLVLLSGGALTACGDDAGAGGTRELLYLAPGNPPAGWSDILRQVNKKMTEDDVGYTLRIQWTNWNEYANVLLLKSTSGEDFDAALDAPWAHMQRLISSDSYIALDDKIDGYPNLEKSLPPESWNANKFFGKIYGLPQGVNYALTGFAVRTDLVEKYGFGELRTLDDIERYLYEVKDNEPDAVPFGIDKSNAGLLAQWLFNAALWEETPGRYANAEALGLWYDVEEEKMVLECDNQDWVDAVRRAHGYHQDGLINSDFLNITKDDVTKLFASGTVGAAVLNAGDQLTADHGYGPVRQNVAGADVDAVFPFTSNAPRPYSTFAYWNFVCVNANAKNPDGILALEDWLSIKENHDLLQYGIQGRDWEPDGDDGYTSTSQYSFPGYVLTWRPGLERVSSSMSPKDREWNLWSREPDNFTPSPIAGFHFDDTPVKTETAQMSATIAELGPPLTGGVTDPSSGVEEYRDALRNAGSDAVLAEVQKQVDEFLTT